MTVSIISYEDDAHAYQDVMLQQAALLDTSWMASYDPSKPFAKMNEPTIIDDTGGDWYGPAMLAQGADMYGMRHVTTSVSVGQLEDTSHQANGSAFFGAGNSTASYLKLFDHTSNIEFGLEAHYRTGDYVTPVNVGGNWIATMKAGIQDGTHNEQGINTTRSGASFDMSMNFGNGGPQDGKFVLEINGHQFTLSHSDPTHWFFADQNGTAVQGLTLSPDGHTLQDSANLAFFSNILIHGTNPADIKPQDVHISLTEMNGIVGVASVSETIHLVAPVA